MEGNTIKSFLVGLGFEVNESSLAKFNKSIVSATARITALYAGIKIASAGIVAGVAKISEGFEQLGYELRIIAPAINKTIVLRNEMMKAYSAAGINISEVAKNSVKLNMSLTKTKFILDALYKSVGSKFFTYLTKQSDVFRQNIYKNLPRIQAALEKFVKVMFKALEVTIALGARVWSILTRVYDFFVSLHKATDGWSSIIMGVIAAWKLLNLSFLATPLGQLIAGIIALIALYDDFKVWEEGGESLFNWEKFLPVIDAVKTSLLAIKAVIISIVDVIGNLVLAIYQLFQLDFDGFWESLKQAALSVANVFKSVIAYIKSMFSSVGALASFVTGAVGGLFGDDQNNVAQNIQNNPAARPSAAPLGSGASSNLTNQNVKQQTNINIMGTSDANMVGKAVASEQTKVNFDLVRNLRGSTR